MNREKTDTTTAWFGALCFFLSTIEYAIPKPLPFLRLGIANVPVMLAIDILPFPAYCALVLIKILGQGLIGGTLFSYVFLFSAAGSVSSALIMLLLRKSLNKKISWIGISVAGAFASNAAQLIFARFYIFGESAWYIAPPFFAVGVVSGTLLGIFANVYEKKSRWYEALRSELRSDLRTDQAVFPAWANGTAPATAPEKSGFWRHPAFRISVGAIFLLTLMFSDSLILQAGITGLSLALVLADKTPVKPVPALVMMAGIVLFNLFVPFGKVLITPLGVPITEGALVSGIKKALLLEGMIFISKWMLKPGISLPGKAGKLVSQAFGILNKLSSQRKKIDPKNLIESIDSIMYGRD
jgi:uncharacterized membrane protein